MKTSTYNHCLRIAVRGISAQWDWPFRILPQRREILAEPTGRERPQRGRTTLSASDRAICFDDQQISVIARTGTLLLKAELVVRGQQRIGRREDITGRYDPFRLAGGRRRRIGREAARRIPLLSIRAVACRQLDGRAIVVIRVGDFDAELRLGRRQHLPLGPAICPQRATT